MKINEEIFNITRRHKLEDEEVMAYLLPLHFGYFYKDFSPNFLISMNITKIVERDGDKIKWNIPLFEGQEIAFEWVKTEYVELFRPAGKATNVRESTARMKKFFASNPSIRKDDVLEATKMYLNSTDVRYIRLPHYFIEKGFGTDKTFDLLEWVEKRKLTEDIDKGRNSNSNSII